MPLSTEASIITARAFSGLIISIERTQYPSTNRYLKVEQSTRSGAAGGGREGAGGRGSEAVEGRAEAETEQRTVESIGTQVEVAAKMESTTETQAEMPL